MNRIIFIAFLLFASPCLSNESTDEGQLSLNSEEGCYDLLRQARSSLSIYQEVELDGTHIGTIAHEFTFQRSPESDHEWELKMITSQIVKNEDLGYLLVPVATIFLTPENHTGRITLGVHIKKTELGFSFGDNLNVSLRIAEGISGSYDSNLGYGGVTYQEIYYYRSTDQLNKIELGLATVRISDRGPFSNDGSASKVDAILGRVSITRNIETSMGTFYLNPEHWKPILIHLPPTD